MTREEELDWLYRLRSEIYVYMPKEWLIPMNNALDMAIKELEQEPRTGHWIYIGNSGVNGLKICKCSNCKKKTYGSHKFCPNCGAKMEGEE